MSESIYLIIGSLGAGILLVLFVLNQLKRISRDSLTYDFWNFIGALLLSIYSALIRSYPFLILNLVWMLVSLRDVLKNKTKN